jgi:hypothetical protein
MDEEDKKKYLDGSTVFDREPLWPPRIWIEPPTLF